jgi:gluconate 5-dehydrogenase
MSKVSFDLTGKVALVTGATHGIGMAVAKGLAQQGAKICVNDIDDARLEACKEEYKKTVLMSTGSNSMLLPKKM